MPETKQSDPIASAKPALDVWLLAATLAAVPLACATGFSRYEVLKLGLLAVLGGLGGLGLVVFLVDFCRGQNARWLGGGLAGLAGWGLVVAGAVSLLWAPGVPGPAAGLGRWLILMGIFARVAARRVGPDWIAGPLAFAGAACAALMLAGRLGLDVPPPVPTGMAFDAGAHGPFDHVVFAGAFLLVVGPVALYAAANATRVGARAGYLVAALLIYAGVGLVDTALATILGGASLLFGLALSFGQLKGWAGATPVWAATMLALVALVGVHLGLGPAPAVEAGPALPGMAPSLYETVRLEGPENAVTSGAEWSFTWGQSLGAFGDATALGKGVGSFSYYNGLYVPAEEAYYAGPRQEYHLHDSPPGVVAGLLAEQGVVGLVLGLLFFGLIGLAAVFGLLRPEEAQAPGAGYLVAGAAVTLVVAALSPALYHAGEGVAVMAALGLVVRLEAPGAASGVASPRRVGVAGSAFARFERWALLGVPALALLGFTAWQTGRFAATDFLRQRGELYLMAHQTEDAITSLEAAVAFEPDDYRAEHVLGLTRYYTPTDQARRDAARDNLTRAAALAPYDVRVQLQALKNELQRGGDDMTERLSAAGTVRNRLLDLRRRDPRNVAVHLQLADAQQALGDYDQAVAAFLGALELTDDPVQLAEIHRNVGDLFSDQLDDPELALEHYEMAMETALPRSPLADHVAERIGFVREWIRRGSRPAVPGGHTGEGPDLEQDHEDAPPLPPSIPLPPPERLPDEGTGAGTTP